MVVEFEFENFPIERMILWYNFSLKELISLSSRGEILEISHPMGMGTY